MDTQQLTSLLHAQNFRLTRERQKLLDLFSQAAGMLTPGQLHQEAQSQQLNVGLTTVYRLLEVLTHVGAATPFLLDGSVYYAFCEGSHHHHFVCLSCHQVRDIPECPSFAQLPDSYRVQSHRVDLFGTCPDCLARQPQPVDAIQRQD